MKYMVRIVLILSLLHFARAQTSLQPYHWTWIYLDYLKSAGLLPALNLTDRPWQVENIDKALSAIDLHTCPSEYVGMIRLLKKNYSHIQKGLLSINAPNTHISTGMFALGQFGKTDLRDNTGFDYDFHPYMLATFGKHIALYANYKIFNRPRPAYIGKKFRNLFAYEEQGYLYFQKKFLSFKIGRDFIQTGPGRSGQLLISDNSRPFDQYQFKIGLKNIYLKFYGIQLDKRRVPQSDSTYGGQIARRFINGHGIYFNIKDRYFVNINELVLYGGPHVFWQMALMNPLNIYYGATANGPYMTANSFYDINFDLYFNHGFNVYGDLLIDDFQVDKKEPGDLEPDEIGLLLGGIWTNPFGWKLSRLNVEYVQVRNRTYNAPVLDWEKFVHRNEVIGYYLGNDLKAWYFSLEKWWDIKFYTKLYAQRILKGEGSVLGEFNKDYLNYSVKEGYKEAFPWGVVERKMLFGIKISYYVFRDNKIDVLLGYESINNLEHRIRNTKKGMYFKIGAWMGL